ncbi:MAG: hypothetical protein JW904_02405 [Spirochaetales bacterium]|nr:hypothetical protein [Spirochaetales bacterium]
MKKTKYIVLSVLCIVFLVTCTSTPVPSGKKTAEPGKIIAFPGADGAGAYTIGGRGGKVIEVTNLKDSGQGSLREAIETEGPRTVVFRVSGTIELESPLLVMKPYITIAGQTAPGDGICIKNYLLRILTDHVIVRFIRVRLGTDAKQEYDSIDIAKGRYIIIDHVSASWSVDETLSVSFEGIVDNVSVQWCFITESLNNSIHAKGDHGFGSLIRGGLGVQYTYHHNLYAHHRARLPRPGNYANTKKDPKGLFFEFANNVVYDWGGEYAGYNMDKDSYSSYNFIGNYYISGQNSEQNIAFREYCPEAKAYFRDNYMNGVKPADPWSLVDFDEVFPKDRIASYKQSSPIKMVMIKAEDAAEAYKKIIDKAGASVPNRDSIDARIVSNVLTKKGKIIDNVTDVGGYPVYRSTEPPADSDHDGMPDNWETANKLDPKKDDSAQDANSNGYTNLEEYLNSLAAASF